MTTLLEMAQAIAEETGFNVPSKVIGSAEETDKRLKRALDKGGELTARAHAWSALHREYEFTTVASQESYDLSALNLRYVLAGTAWNRTDYWEMRGSLSPREWQIRKSGLGNQVGLRDRYRLTLISGGASIRINPVPGGAETLVFEYVSNNWIASATKRKFTADTDEPDIDPFLVELAGLWCFQRAEGLAYGDSYAEWAAEVSRQWMRDAMPGEVNLACDPVVMERMPLANVPSTGYGL